MDHWLFMDRRQEVTVINFNLKESLSTDSHITEESVIDRGKYALFGLEARHSSLSKIKKRNKSIMKEDG